MRPSCRMQPSFKASHRSLSRATSGQSPPAKATISSSHLFKGRPTFLCAHLLNHGFQVSKRVAQRPSMHDVALPANFHFRVFCKLTPLHDPCFPTTCSQMCVALRMYSTQLFSESRGVHTMQRIIRLLVVVSFCSSAIVNVHALQP